MIRLIIWCKPIAKYILIAWFIAIFTVSSIPSIPTLKIHTSHSVIRLDYLIHFCEYGFLAFLALLSSAGNDFHMNYRKLTFITLGLVLFAIIDEFHQKLIPGRSFNVKDILSNISGILTALLFCIIVFRYIAGKIEKTD